MDTTDSLGNGLGGGEVLDYIGKTPNYNYDSPYLNNELIRQFNLIPIVRIIIALIIIYIMVKFILKLYNMKSFRKGRGIINELEYVDMVKKRDSAILRYNRLISKITALVEKTAFRVNKHNVEYIEYNIYRAGLKIPGGARVLRAEEFNAIIVAIEFIICIVGLIVTLVANYIFGIAIIIFNFVIMSTAPMMFLRQTVKAKDDEIRENFSDFYLMLHYVLMVRSKTSLTSVMKSYAKTTDSDVMKSMVDTCVHYFDTYGEYDGATYISKAYREIPIMCKLMRLIRQSFSGGDVEAELIGFRQELLQEKRYAIEKRTTKLINKAKRSFNILLPILVQAILSAMSIYLSDMGAIQTFVS